MVGITNMIFCIPFKIMKSHYIEIASMMSVKHLKINQINLKLLQFLGIFMRISIFPRKFIINSILNILYCGKYEVIQLQVFLAMHWSLEQFIITLRYEKMKQKIYWNMVMYGMRYKVISYKHKYENIYKYIIKSY